MPIPESPSGPSQTSPGGSQAIRTPSPGSAPQSGSGTRDPALRIAPLAPEEVIADRYVLKHRLGAGGMGEAWLAEDRILHRRLVLKRLTRAHPAKSALTAQLLSEARRATAIDSPHIAQVYDICTHGDEWLLAIEYVPGMDLRTVLAGPLDPETFFSLAVQLAVAIQAAHAAGILHCDIKPENIMVTEQGFVKVLDFGLARIVASPGSFETVSLAGSGSVFAGTPGYMAPEVLREHAPTELSDIFALGVVLYEMAGGKAPFKGKTTADSVLLTLTSEPAPIDLKARGFPPDLNRILAKALNKQPERRYATVRDLLVDLRALQHQTLTSVLARPRSGGPQKWRKVLFVAAPLALLVLACAGVWFLVQHHPYRSKGAQVSPRAAAPAPRAQLLAVLPFHVIGPENAPDAAAMSAYSEGLREAITTSLASLAPAAKIEVLAASEVRAHGLKTPEEAHKELGADLAIDGSYQQFRDEVHITYELSNAKGTILQSGNLMEKLADPFAMENHVESGVLAMLRATPGGTELAPQRFGTQNPEAYDAYLRGMGYLRDYDIADSIQNAAKSFAAATHADPQFAAAFAGLGEAQWAEYQATTDVRMIPPARASCARALELGPGVAEARICQATIDDGTGRVQAAQAGYQQALQLDPQSDSALNGLARTWEEMEKPEQAQHVYQQAIEARPFYWANYYALANFLVRRADYAGAAQQLEQAVEKFPENSFVARRLGVVYFLEGKLDDAASILQKAIAERPQATAWMDLGEVYLHQRQFGRAIPALEAAARMEPQLNSIQADLGDAYAWSGNAPGAIQDKAAASYRSALSLSQAGLKVNPMDLDALMVAAYSAAALGEQAQAFAYLNQALQHAPEDAEVNYYAARVYARLNEPAAARQAIDTAVAHGYSQADIATAPDLAELVGAATQ
ncbi:MAG TPA: protein kinase [Acidobacteriaceae bacterium]